MTKRKETLSGARMPQPASFSLVVAVCEIYMMGEKIAGD
jgi:hypothetical protein